MFLPIGDSPNPERFTPWVNYALIAVNVAIFLLTYLPLDATLASTAPQEALQWLRQIRAQNPAFQPTEYDIFTYLHGYKPGAPELTDLFSAMFLHAGWGHLLGNMLFLWIYGDNIEHRLGRFRYLLLYLVTGVAATIGFSLMNPGSTVPMIGASGAISGVLGMYFIMFPHNVVKVLVLLFPFLIGVYPFNARLVLGFYIIVQNVFPALLASAGGGGVAYGAHIGGFVAGLAVAFAAERMTGIVSNQAIPRPLGRRRPPVRARPKGGPEVVHTSSDEQALRLAVGANDRTEAFRQLAKVSAPVAAENLPTETLTVAQWLAEEDQHIQAFELVRQVIRRHRPPAIDQAEVYYTLGLIRQRQGQPTSAFQHFMDALDLGPSEDTEARIRQALSKINMYRRPN